MAQSLTPAQILLSWLVGLVIALSGALAYSALAINNTRSGGEYSYLHDQLHPFLGYLSGWASLIVGFSATVAILSFAAAAYLKKILPELDTFWAGLVLLLILTAVCASSSRLEGWVQAITVFLKFSLVLVFICIGLTLGSWHFPEWHPPNYAGPNLYNELAESQYWIAYGFSGWNAAIYVSHEFKDPQRNVPRAMLWGCTLVGSLYILINWVIVANLPPAMAGQIITLEDEKITLAHLVMEYLAGPQTSQLVSVAAILVFISSICVMTILGPRIYSAMAADRLMPASLAQTGNGPPLLNYLLQLIVTLLLYCFGSLLTAVNSAATILMLFSSLACLIVLIGKVPASGFIRFCAFFYILSTACIFYFAPWSHLAITTSLIILLLAGIGYYLSRQTRLKLNS